MSLPVELTLSLLPRDIQHVANQPAYTKIGTVRDVVPMDGQPAYAIVDFDDETGVETKLMSGNGTPTTPGQLVRAVREGGVIDASWQIVEVLNGPRISFGEPIAAILPVPTIPSAANGGIYSKSSTATDSNKNAVSDPNAPVKARVYLFPRTIVPGFYSVYQARAHGIRTQTRELGQTDWADASADIPIVPASILRGTLNANILASATSIAITIPSDRIAEVPTGHPVYWRIGAEIIRARAVNDGGGVFTLTVVNHDGASDASLGDGFNASTSGRGVESTTAEAHDEDDYITLLSCAIVPADLRPETDYELRIAFVNASGQPGPWSNVVGFTSWEQPVPPAAPDNLTVVQLSHVINATWDRVLEDANGEPMSDVRRYIVVRAVAALTVTFSLAQVLSAGATLIGDDVNATAVPVPATKGNGNYIGVAAVSSNGLLSDWSWQDDDFAPPYPDPSEVTFMSIPRGVLVNVPTNADSRNSQTGATVATPSQLDEGFKEFWLWQASDSSGSSATVKHVFTTSQTTLEMTSGLTGWFKVTAADGAGNSNGPATYPSNTPKAGESNPNTANWSSGWQFCASLYAEGSLPPNGNFQDPNNANTDARGWSRLVHPGWVTAGGLVTPVGYYETTGGLEGNRVYRINADHGETNIPAVYLISDVIVVIPAHDTGVSGELWVRHNRGVDVDMGAAIWLTAYASDDGSGASLGDISVGGTGIITTGTWTRITLSASSVRGTYATARSVKFFIAVNDRAGAMSNPAYDIWIDAGKMTFN